MGCMTDAVPFLDKACSGKSSCEYVVPGPDLVATQPCPRGFTSYLDVKYECIKGNTQKCPAFFSSSMSFKLLVDSKSDTELYHIYI